METTAATTQSGGVVHAAGEPSPRWWVWAGRVASALPVLAMGLSAIMKLTHSAQVVSTFQDKFGYSESALTGIGVLEIFCAVLYVIPQTAVLGGILVTAYLGGAVATHVRIADPAFIGPVILGILAWVGLYLRDARLRELLPLRRR
jgi:hypothetical protein